MVVVFIHRLGHGMDVRQGVCRARRQAYGKDKNDVVKSGWQSHAEAESSAGS